MKYIVLILVCFAKYHNAVKVIYDHTVDLETIKSKNLVSSDIMLVPNQLLIFPGTKWCGAGNVANNESDLGYYAETDKCCRTHDHCSDSIGGFQTKHNLTNPVFYTRSHCDCDNLFFGCLKASPDDAADEIGFIYFNVLGTQCFKEEYPIISCNQYVYNLYQKCTDYDLDENGAKKYQWFDVPSY